MRPCTSPCPRAPDVLRRAPRELPRPALLLESRPGAADPSHELGQSGGGVQSGRRRGGASPPVSCRRTQRTIRTKEQFLRCLAETRERGYAFCVEEDEPGLASVAAPVLDHTGIARAAISVAGPGLPRVRRTHARDGSPRAGGRPPADEHRVGLVERVGLSLTVFRQSRTSFRRARTHPFQSQHASAHQCCRHGARSAEGGGLGARPGGSFRNPYDIETAAGRRGLGVDVPRLSAVRRRDCATATRASSGSSTRCTTPSRSIPSTS